MSIEDQVELIRATVEAKYAQKDHVAIPPEEVKRLQIVFGQIFKGQERDKRLRAVRRVFPVGIVHSVESFNDLSLGQSLALRETALGSLMMAPDASISGDFKDLMLELANG